MFNRMGRAIGLASVALVLATGAAAQGAGYVYGSSETDDPGLAGVTVAQSATAFSYQVKVENHFDGGSVRQGQVSGSLSTRVVRATDGTLDFYWRIAVDSESFIGVVEFRVAGFSGFSPRLGWRSDLGLGQEPYIWYDTGSETGILFREAFEASIEPGQRSRFFFADTNAREYAQSAAATVLSDDTPLRHTVTGHMAGLATFTPAFPLTAVPEPQTWALMLLGGLGVAVAARRRRVTT